MLLAGQFKRLKAACAVAALGSTVRAAEALHLSQSSVARAVQELEEALGQSLFDRSGRGMRPAAAAAQLLRRAARALNHLAHARPLTHKPLDGGLDWLADKHGDDRCADAAASIRAASAARKRAASAPSMARWSHDSDRCSTGTMRIPEAANSPCQK